MPDHVSSRWTDRLTNIFGDERWRNLYKEPDQLYFFGNPRPVRDPGVDGLISIYKGKLERLFGNRLRTKSLPLTNLKISPLFEFFFCVGHPKGIKVAKRIAKHILEHI